MTKINVLLTLLGLVPIVLFIGSLLGIVNWYVTSIIGIICVVALAYIRYRLKAYIEAIEKVMDKGRYQTSTQVIHDLQNDKIVCFVLNDDVGFLIIKGENLQMHMRKDKEGYYATSVDKLEDAIDELGNLGIEFFRNGTLFEVQPDSGSEHCSCEEEACSCSEEGCTCGCEENKTE